MTLASLIDGQLAYGMTPLLDRASLTVTDGERIASSAATAPASHRCSACLRAHAARRG